MDPEAALNELLALIDQMLALGEQARPGAGAHTVARIVELVDGLDSWLAFGGYLPHRWHPARR